MQSNLLKKNVSLESEDAKHEAYRKQLIQD